MDPLPLLLVGVAIVLALVLFNIGWAVAFRDVWNDTRSRAREPDAIDRLHELVTRPDRAQTGVPDRFAVLGQKAHLTGADQPCQVCAPFRGRLVGHDDPAAPRLPIAGCEHPRGCTCIYV